MIRAKAAQVVHVGQGHSHRLCRHENGHESEGESSFQLDTAFWYDESEGE